MKITRFRDVPQFTRDGSYQVDMGLEWLIDKVKEWQSEEGLDIDPDFQRGHVWNERQQIAYMEFLLKGGKTARVLYFNKPSWHNAAKTKYDDFVLVDGKQRLETIRRFVKDEIEVFGSKRSEYTDNMRLTQGIKVNINDLQTKAEVLQWYLNFNAGGVVHTDDELEKVRKMLAKERKVKK